MSSQLSGSKELKYSPPKNEECETCQWFGGSTLMIGGVYVLMKRNTVPGRGGRPMSWVLGLGLIGGGFYMGFVDTYLKKYRGWPPLL